VAITLGQLEALRAAGMLPARARVLDIGCSNLNQVDAPALRRFIVACTGRECTREDETFVANLVKRTTTPTGIYAGELLEQVGMEYLALDVADGYGTEIFDLNRQGLPESRHGRFQVVLNFGTTEHVMNQQNAFRVIHDAAGDGAWMIHDLPGLGYLDHGLFLYTPRFFFSLAARNHYEIVEVGYTGPGDATDLPAALRRYRDKPVEVGMSPGLAGERLADAGLRAVLRKRGGVPFESAIDVTGASGTVVIEDAQRADRAGPRAADPMAELRDAVLRIEARLGRVTLNELRQMRDTLAKLERTVPTRFRFGKIGRELARPFRKLRQALTRRPS
jgi:hypothetical protein